MKKIFFLLTFVSLINAGNNFLKSQCPSCPLTEAKIDTIWSQGYLPYSTNCLYTMDTLWKASHTAANLTAVLAAGNNGGGNFIYNVPTLRDATPLVSVNVSGRFLQRAHIGQTVLDWQNMQLLDSNTIVSIDWQKRLWRDPSALVSVNASSRILQRAHIGMTVLDWQNMQLLDSSTAITLDWQARLLKKKAWTYSANFGAQFNSRSIIDKGYADSLFSTIVTSQWVTLGSNIYYNTGRVGIGITIPLAPIHIKNTVSTMMILQNTNDTSNTIYLINRGLNSHTWAIASNGKYQASTGPNSFSIYDSTAGSQRYIIDSLGKHGINMIPLYTINAIQQVGGNSIAQKVWGGTAGSNSYPLDIRNSTAADVVFFLENTSASGYGGVISCAANDDAIYALQIRGNTSTPVMSVYTSGRVNIPLLKTFATNADAITGGLVAGDLYLVTDAVTGSKIIEIVQ